MAAALKIKVLSAAVRVNQLDQGGKPKLQQVGWGSDAKPILEPSTKLVFLSRGDDLPENIAHGELDRLKANDAVGTAEEVSRFGEAVRSSAPEPEPAPLDPAVEPASLKDLASASDEQLVALYAGKKPTIDQLVEAVGNDPALAQRVLAAESSATSGDVRDGLQQKLDKVIAASQVAAAAPDGFTDLNSKDAQKAVVGYTAEQLDAAEAAEKARTGDGPRVGVLTAIDKRREALKAGS